MIGMNVGAVEGRWTLNGPIARGPAIEEKEAQWPKMEDEGGAAVVRGRKKRGKN